MAPWPVPDDVPERRLLSATVTPPTVGVADGGSGVGLALAVGVGTGVSLAGVEGDFDADGCEVGFVVALAVAFGVVPGAAVATG
jgi:hypothetical protein